MLKKFCNVLTFYDYNQNTLFCLILAYFLSLSFLNWFLLCYCDSYNNKKAFFFLYYLWILGFCFTDIDFPEVQTVHHDLYVAILFTNLNQILLFAVFLLQIKQFFFFHISFTSHFYIAGCIFLIKYLTCFKCLNIIDM